MKTDAIAHVSLANCLNCGTAVHDHFCAHCGQDTANHLPTAGEFMHEFVGHFVAFENKLLKTLVLLIFRPGRLTREYLEGKRVRYVLPLRLYLTLSLLFFAIFKWEAHEHFDRYVEIPPTVQQSVVDKAPAGDKAAVAAAPQEAKTAVIAAVSPRDKVAAKLEQKAEQLKRRQAAGGATANDVHMFDVDAEGQAWVARHLSVRLADKLAHFHTLSGSEQLRACEAALFEFGPYAIFAMMPVFALFLKLLYLGSGRRYGEHLLFALHTNAFAFLVLGILMLMPSWIPYAHGALFLWLMFYLPTAMRKVYGCSRRMTFLRWTVLMALHLTGMLVAMVGAVAMAVVV